MSTTHLSRADISCGTTLADVIMAIGQADLPDRRRQELTSAVRTVARALGRRVEEIPADPRLLANRLSEVAEVAIGLSPGRWANVKSLLRAAMSQVREMSPGRHLTPLSASWQTQWDRLPTRLQRRVCRGSCILRALRASIRKPLPSQPSRRFGSISMQPC